MRYLTRTCAVGLITENSPRVPTERIGIGCNSASNSAIAPPNTHG